MARVLLAADPGPPRTHGLLRMFLESAGHEVHEVCDGGEALETLRASPPEVLVFDIALPTFDGFHVLARLRSGPGPGKVPTLVISTIPAALGSQLVASLGGAAYLQKPFTFQALLEAVEETLAPPGEAEALRARRASLWRREGGDGAVAPPEAAQPPRRGTRHRPAG